MMKKIVCAVLALVMVLSLAACGSKQDDNGGKTDVDLTAQEVLDKLKETLGDSYGCDAQDDEDRMTNYYGLDMSQVDSWASEASSMSALDPTPPLFSRSRTATPTLPPICCVNAISRCWTTARCIT